MKVKLKAFDILEGSIEIKEFVPELYIGHFEISCGFLHEVHNPSSKRILKRAVFKYCEKCSSNRMKCYCFSHLKD